MSYTQTYRRKIDKKVFTKENILQLGSVILSEYELIDKDASWKSIVVKAECDDDSTYEGKDLSIFRNGDIADRKRMNTIWIGFTSRQPEKEVKLTLSSGVNGSGRLTVSGEDHNWVNGTFRTLEEILEATKPQEAWTVKHKGLLGVIITLCGFGLVTAIFHALHRETNSWQAWIMFIVPYLVFAALGQWGLWKLNSAWPDIEFAFGPIHKRIEETRRERAAALFALVIVPLLLAIGYDLVKAAI